jgi:hypothetical protein
MKFLNHNLFTGDITVNGTTTLSTATGVTRATGDNTTHLATTAFVKAQDYATNTALGNYVPISRTLTINNVTYDLSANRSWTIGTSDYTSVVKHAVKAGVAITKGQAIYVTSADGTNMIVGLASNTSEATSSKTMGLAETTVAANGFTNVITEGLLAGLDTSTAGTEGDPVWLGVNGNLIYGLLNKPYAPAHLVFIGIVTRKNANNGEIFVKVQNGFELNEIHDVDLKTNIPINGEILGFNGTLWVNKTIATWLGYTPANASGTTNYVSKFTGTTTLGNSQIFDNGTNVGIGTTSPNAKLDVNSGAGAGSTDLLSLSRSAGYGATVFNQTYDSTYFANGKTLTLKNDAGTAFIHFAGNNAGTQTNVLIPTGNVGIGTTSPSTKLDVIGTGVFGTMTTSRGSYSNGLSLQNNGGQATSLFLWQNGVASAHIGSPANSTSLHIVNSYNTGSITDPNAIVLDNTGNVGIGTTSPAAKLHTVGSGIVNIVQSSDTVSYTQYYNSSTGSTSTSDGLTVGLNGLDAYIFHREAANLILGTSDTERLRITSAGNVGIGTTSPDSKLHVVSASSNMFRMVRSQNNFGFEATSTSSGGYGLYDYQNSAYDLYLQAGKIGIGTTSPSNKLQVANGDMSITTGYSFILADTDTNWRLGRNIITPVESVYLNSNTFEFVAANALDQGWQFINDDGYPVLEIGAATGSRNVWVNAGNLLVPTGSVGIGTTSPGAKLHVAGNAWINRPSNKVDNASCTELPSRVEFNNSFAAGASGYTIFTYPTPSVFRIYADYDGNVGGVQPDLQLGLGYLTVKNSGGTIGNVGIGTTGPTEKLHVDGRARITTIDNGTGDFATISGTGVITRRTAAQVLSDIGAQPSGSYLTAEADTLATVTGRGASTSTAITIQGGWASTILNGDNVVLRKPNYSGGGWARTLLNFQEYTTTSLFQIGGYGSNNVMTYGYLGSAYNTPTFRWYANKDVVFDGNVGLGVVGPGNKLVVDGVAQSTIAKFYTSDNNYSTVEVGDTGDVYASVYMQTDSGNGQLFKYGAGWGTESGMVGLYSSNGPIALQAGGSTKVFVQSGGNVGIGTSSPGTKLDVNGVITATGGNSTNWNTAYGWGNHASAGYLTSYTETDTLATVTARGSSTNGSIFINGVFTGGLGAVTTSGTLDWNDVSNARAGQGYTLLLGTATNGMGGGQYYHPVSFEYSSKNGSGNMTQLAIPYTGNGIWYRNRYGGSWSSWARVWDDSSFTSTNISNWNTAYGWGNHASQGYATQTYVNTAIANLVDSAPSTLDTLNELAAALGDDPNFATTVTNSIAAKLPLAGGTMTGTIYFSNDMGTALQGTIGDNDFWRIRGGNSGSNAGFLEIATSDDGTEPIYVRQYTGVFSSLTRTATLLDGSGNTSLPGSLTVGGTITENSSIRYKENVVNLESATEKVEQLRAVRYNKIGHELEEIGLIAEEVAEVYPEVVNYNEEGQPDGVNYTRLSVILLKAVQELTERINKLESK